jgi:F-type H+-transporting ATPase subunit gamma
MQKAQDRALRALPYAQGIYEIVSRIGNIKDFKSPYLREVALVKRIAVVVIGTSRGFVGGQLATLTAAAYKLNAELQQKYPGAEILGISLHKTGLRVLSHSGIKSELHFAEYVEAPTTTDLTAIFSLLTEKFANGEYDEVHLAYTHFINTIAQKAVTKKLLPISLEELVSAAKTATEGELKAQRAYIFEPDPKTVLNFLLPEYFHTQVYTALLEATASEHSARMVAMKNATDNAMDLKKSLTLKYNSQRQAKITQELIEIINGSK